MAFHFLIDGYNLLYAWKELPAGTWQEKRKRLLDFLKSRTPQGNNAVTVIFDSREGLGDQSRDQEITIIFTAGETADDWISNQVRRAANPRALVVVSNDKGLRALVRGTGARVVSSDEFLKAAFSPRRQGKPSAAGPPAAEEITEEFKKKWL